MGKIDKLDEQISENHIIIIGVFEDEQLIFPVAVGRQTYPAVFAEIGDMVKDHDHELEPGHYISFTEDLSYIPTTIRHLMEKMGLI